MSSGRRYTCLDLISYQQRLSILKGTNVGACTPLMKGSPSKVQHARASLADALRSITFPLPNLIFFSKTDHLLHADLQKQRRHKGELRIPPTPTRLKRAYPCLTPSTTFLKAYFTRRREFVTNITRGKENFAVRALTLRACPPSLLFNATKPHYFEFMDVELNFIGKLEYFWLLVVRLGRSFQVFFSPSGNL